MDFFKFVILCLIRASGYFNKTIEEQEMSKLGANGMLIFAICFGIMLLLIYPKEWKPFVAVLVSSMPAILVMLIYFFLVYHAFL